MGGKGPESGGEGVPNKPKVQPALFVKTQREVAEARVREQHNEAQRKLDAARKFYKAKDKDGQREVQRSGDDVKRMGELRVKIDNREITQTEAAEFISLFGRQNIDRKLFTFARESTIEEFKIRAEKTMKTQDEYLAYALFVSMHGKIPLPNKDGERELKNLVEALQSFTRDLPKASRKGQEAVKVVYVGFFRQIGVPVVSQSADNIRTLTVAAQSTAKTDLRLKMVRNKVAVKVFYQKATDPNTKNPEEAFLAAIESSTELREQYEEYLKTWEQDQSEEVLEEKPDITKIPGSASPDTAHVNEAQQAIAGTGVDFKITNGNEGRIQFGALKRDAVIIDVNNSPQLVVYDQNADRGFVGPIEPAKAKETMRGIAIDAYFTRKFRKFSTMDSEKDPAKMKDSKLLDAVHKFLPNGGEGNTDKLSMDEQAIIENLVKLLVKPDKESVLTEDKVRFLLEYVAVDPQRLAKAKKLLSTKRGEGDKGLSLSDL